MSTYGRRAGISLVLLGLVTWEARARAQGRESAAARLFEEARVLQSRGRHDEACARFEASEKIEPAVGTLLNLAECAERKDATATALHRYRQAAAMAARRADAEREALATRQGDAIEQRLSKLVLHAPAKGLPSSATVSRDDEVVPPAELGAAVAVDPGEHRLSVKAPGFKPWSTSIKIGSGPTVADVDLPPLEPEDADAPRGSDIDGTRRTTVAPAISRPSEQNASSPESSRPSSSSTLARTWPWIAGGVGVAAATIGSYFALRARSVWADVETRCPGGRCPDAATADALRPQQAEAQHDATLGTIVIISGGVAIGVAVLGALLMPKPPSSTRAAGRTGLFSPRLIPTAYGQGVFFRFQ